jgi:hypothetical protein
MLTKQSGSAATRAIQCLILAATAAAFVPAAVVAADDGESKTLPKNLYQQSALPSSPCVASAGVCSILFPATTDAVTIVTSVSCVTVLPPGALITYGVLGPQSSTTPLSVLPVFTFPGQDAPDTVNWGINTSTNVIFNKGDRPVVTISTIGGNHS